jgi:hypothetical protein
LILQSYNTIDAAAIEEMKISLKPSCLQDVVVIEFGSFKAVAHHAAAVEDPNTL